jgi:hypothetical protein
MGCLHDDEANLHFNSRGMVYTRIIRLNERLLPASAGESADTWLPLQEFAVLERFARKGPM